MYRPESKNGLYIFLIASLALIIGWIFLYQYRPVLIEANCSDVAASSTNLFGKNQNILDPNYDYNYLKAKCLEDAKYAKVAD